MSVNVISKETIQRLLKDVKNIIKNPLIDNGIHYYHDEEDMMKGYALIIGPEDTPYFGGYYFLNLNFQVTILIHLQKLLFVPMAEIFVLIPIYMYVEKCVFLY